jgi:hypothetical protein
MFYKNLIVAAINYMIFLVEIALFYLFIYLNNLIKW